MPDENSTYVSRYASELDPEEVRKFITEHAKPDDQPGTQVRWATRMLREQDEGEFADRLSSTTLLARCDPRLLNGRCASQTKTPRVSTTLSQAATRGALEPRSQVAVARPPAGDRRHWSVAEAKARYEAAERSKQSRGPALVAWLLDAWSSNTGVDASLPLLCLQLRDVQLAPRSFEPTVD